MWHSAQRADISEEKWMCILWRNRPMRKLLKFRNLNERDCATVAERCRVLPPLPSPSIAPHHELLGCAVTLDGATVRKDHVTSQTSHATVHGAAFSACRIPAFIGETEGSTAPLEFESVFMRAHNQFAVSYQRELRRLLLGIEDLCVILGQ
jgi:hypothetical protein